MKHLSLYGRTIPAELLEDSSEDVDFLLDDRFGHALFEPEGIIEVN